MYNIFKGDVMPEFNIKVENIVASVSLGIKIPLNKLVGKDTEYEPEQFPGVVYRMEKPKTAALIFSSGKIVCTGGRSLKEVKESVANVVKRIRKSGIKVPSNYKIEVENIVASAKIKNRINLDTIAFNLENSEYEPEQFPGLVYRMNDPKVAFLFFSSGKIVCTGGRTVKDVNRAIEKVYKKLKSIGAIIPK